LEWKLLVYCSKCGAKNEDDAKVCVGCGASLYVPKRVTRRRGGDECFGPKEERRFEEECFGLPHGGAFIGIIFGFIILVLGFTWLVGINLWDYIGPLMAILLGILIIVGVIYSAIRR
jgi:ribosomal protein L40E